MIREAIKLNRYFDLYEKDKGVINAIINSVKNRIGINILSKPASLKETKAQRVDRKKLEDSIIGKSKFNLLKPGQKNKLRKLLALNATDNFPIELARNYWIILKECMNILHPV